MLPPLDMGCEGCRSGQPSRGQLRCLIEILVFDTLANLLKQLQGFLDFFDRLIDTICLEVLELLFIVFGRFEFLKADISGSW